MLSRAIGHGLMWVWLLGSSSVLNGLQDVMSSTFHYPETLSNAVASIRASLSAAGPPPAIEPLLAVQEKTALEMAKHLESLAEHYDQMAGALLESETSQFGEEDIRGEPPRFPVSIRPSRCAEMNRDTEELPAVLGELEDGVAVVREAQ